MENNKTKVQEVISNLTDEQATAIYNALDNLFDAV